MAILAGDIITGARALLNDAAGEVYQDTPMLTLLQIVYASFLLTMDLNDIPSLEEISTVIPVTAGSTTISPLPSDFKTPLMIKERAAGSSDLFGDMFQKDWEPERVPTTTLLYWVYREDDIKILPSTADREVKLYYVKDLTIQGTNSVVPILYADVVLKFALAGMAAETIGENYARADRMNGLFQEAQQQFLMRRIKGKQAIPVRRPGFRERKKNNYQFR